MTKFNCFKKKGRLDGLQKKPWPSTQLCRKHLNIIFVIMIIFFGIAYLLQTNDMSVKGYKIKDLENKADELLENNKKLKLQINEKQSLNYINNKLEDFRLVEGGRVDYLSAKINSVAVK